MFVLHLPKRLMALAAATNAPVSPSSCQNAITVLVLYVGLYHIRQGCRGQPIPRNSSAFTLFLFLAENLPPDILRMMVDSIANQLRYPSSHTYYFSTLLLNLFLEVSKERPTREIITRVLLERCIALRPHPWGVMMTFCELLKNTQYNFWAQDFVNCTPEYSNLFDKLYHAESLHTTLSQSLALPGVTSVHA
jgi:CCR4-NOT transcription complex subunit 1